MSIKYIETTKDFEDLIYKSKETICIVDLFAEWCGPCKRITPTFENLAIEKENISFYKYDIDLNIGIEQLKIDSIPTFLVFSKGIIINTHKGGNIDKLKEFVNNLE